MKNVLNNLLNRFRGWWLTRNHYVARNDELKMMIGKLLSYNVITKHSYDKFHELEFNVFSQFGDDGIIQYLIHNIDCKHKTFIEFGAGDYVESNTRFVMHNNNWSGYIIDGSKQNIEQLKNKSFFWRYDLKAEAHFVTKENINDLLSYVDKRWSGVDILHIDIDGNDYWVWKAICLKPTIVIVEYNSAFGSDRAITVPYDPSFSRTKVHYSNLYYGASLKALCMLAEQKGYNFIGCNSAGNNAYFIRKDKMNGSVRNSSLKDGYVRSKFREAKDEKGLLTYADTCKQDEILSGLPVVDVETNEITTILNSQITS